MDMICWSAVRLRCVCVLLREWAGSGRWQVVLGCISVTALRWKTLGLCKTHWRRPQLAQGLIIFDRLLFYIWHLSTQHAWAYIAIHIDSHFYHYAYRHQDMCVWWIIMLTWHNMLARCVNSYASTMLKNARNVLKHVRNIHVRNMLNHD